MKQLPNKLINIILIVLSIVLNVTPALAAPQPPYIPQPQPTIQPRAVGSQLTASGQISKPAAAACTPEIQRHATATYIFTNTTTCTWTVPSNVNKIDILMAGGGGGGGYNGGGGGSGGQIYYSQNIAVVAGNLIDITIGAGGGGGTNASKTGTVGASTSIAIPNVNAGTASYALGGNGGLPCNYILGSASCPNNNRGGASIAGAGNGSAPSSGFGGYGRNFLGSSSSAGAGGTAYVNSVIALAPISLSGGGNGGDTAAGSNGVGYGAGGDGGSFTSIPAGSTIRNGLAGVAGIVVIREVGYNTSVTPSPTTTSTATATNSATLTRTNTATNSATSTNSATLTRTNTATMTSSATATNTATATQTRSNTATATNSNTSTSTLTSTNTQTNTQTQTNTATSTKTNTSTPTNTPTNTQTNTQTQTNTATPTKTSTSTITNTPIILLPTAQLVALGQSGKLITWGDNAPYHLNEFPNFNNIDIAQIAMGEHHALALTKNGSVYGWGTNIKGELTIPSVAQTGVVQIAVGQYHSVALKGDGTVYMWGNSTSLTPPSGGLLTNISQIATGSNHTILLNSTGQVRIYGTSGQQIASPIPVGSVIVAVAASGNNSLALGNNGAVYQWGDSTLTTPLNASANMTQIFAHGGIYGALRRNGDLVLWGAVQSLVIDSNAVSTPKSSDNACPCVTVSNMNGIRSITTAQWGLTIAKRSGQRITYPYTSAQVPSSLPIGAIQLSSYPSYTFGMAIMPNSTTLSTPTATQPANLSIRDLQNNTTLGVLSVWGNYPTVSTIPDAIKPPTQLIQVAAGYRHLVALKPDGIVVAWGDNSYGQATVPSALTFSRSNTDPLRVVAIAAGAFYSMALRANGSVVAWGDNGAGQTNIPFAISDTLNPPATTTNTVTNTSTNTTTATNTNTPNKTSTTTSTNTATRTNTRTNTSTVTPSTTAAPLPYVVQIAAGMRHSVALMSNGTVQGWGDNTYGQINTPYIAGVVKIAAAGWHTVALLRNKTVVAWGRNNYGQTDVTTLTNVVDIAATQDNTIVLLGNGQVVVIGSNAYEQRYVPDGNYQRIGGGVYHLLAIQANGSMNGWGFNANNQLAIPSNIVFPYQVVGGFNFSAALSQSIGSAEIVAATATATIPIIPQIATSLPALSRTNLITIANGTAAAITPFTGNGVSFASNLTGILALDGSVSFTSQTGATLRCIDGNVIPTSLASRSDNYQLLLSNVYGMTLSRSRTVRVWGCNGSVSSDLTTTLIPSAFQNNVAEIALRGTHIMILTVDGRIWSNQYTIPPLSNIRHIAAGSNFASVLLSDGTVRVWALNNLDGILDIPSTATTLTEIAAGNSHIVALRSDGRSISWGANANDVGQADTPFAANSSVVAITAGEEQSMALLRNGTAIAWGNYPAGTSNALDTINANPNYFINGFATGDGHIALYITTVTPGNASPTVISTATAVVVPTMSSRALDIRDQVAWYTMAETTINAMNFSCELAYACPSTVFDGANVLKFNDYRGDELSSTNPLNLNSTIFSVRVRVRRDAINRADVFMSLGTPGTVRGYLSFGFDRENRPYCGFGQDELRSTTWYNDTEWHQYACSYDPISRERTLWRDQAIIARDTVMQPFTPDANARVIIGRRYDTMAGLSGKLSDFEILNRVITTTDLTTPSQISAGSKLLQLQLETQIPNVAPSQLNARCDMSTCPAFVSQFFTDDGINIAPHDGMAAQFCNPNIPSANPACNSRMVINTLPSAPSFTLSLWATSRFRNTNASVISRANIDPSNSQRTTSGLFISLHDNLNGTPSAKCTWVDNFSQKTILEYQFTPRTGIVAALQNWQQFACSYDASQSPAKISFYVNGQLVNSQPVGATVQITGPVEIGYNSMNPMMGETQFNGYVDDVIVYNSAVSAATIIQIYNATTPDQFLATAIPTACPSACATTTFTPTRTFTNSPTRVSTKTPLPASWTPSMQILPSKTPTMTSTLTSTTTRTTSPTSTLTFTTFPTATPSNSQTRTPTSTRTPLFITRTIMAIRSPTYYIQTQIASSWTRTPSTTSTITVTSTVTNTSTRTATPLLSPTPYPYPIAGSASNTRSPNSQQSSLQSLVQWMVNLFR